MKTKLLLSMLVMLSLALAAGSSSFAQTNPVFIQLGQAKGALYKPDSGPPPLIGIIVMHRESNYMNNIACREFSRRGFMVLCMNSRFENNEALVDWELIPLDVAQGVNHLRNVQQMSKVILYGNSGGGVTMSFYQAVAENGPSVCQGPNKLVQCGNNLAGLTPADGIILSDGHPGNPILRLRSVNPAITNEKRPERLNSRLDPFDPNNGYNPNGSSQYSDAFKSRYFKAQAERMNRLIDDALELLQKIEAGQATFIPMTLLSVFQDLMARGCCRWIRASVTQHSFRKNCSKMTATSQSSLSKASPRLVPSSKRQTKPSVRVPVKA